MNFGRISFFLSERLTVESFRVSVPDCVINESDCGTPSNKKLRISLVELELQDCGIIRKRNKKPYVILTFKKA